MNGLLDAGSALRDGIHRSPPPGFSRVCAHHCVAGVAERTGRNGPRAKHLFRRAARTTAAVRIGGIAIALSSASREYLPTSNVAGVRLPLSPGGPVPRSPAGPDADTGSRSGPATCSQARASSTRKSLALAGLLMRRRGDALRRPEALRRHGAPRAAGLRARLDVRERRRRARARGRYRAAVDAPQGRAGHGRVLRGRLPRQCADGGRLARRRPPLRTAALVRLPLQVPLVLWARGVAKAQEAGS